MSLRDLKPLPTERPRPYEPPPADVPRKRPRKRPARPRQKYRRRRRLAALIVVLIALSGGLAWFLPSSSPSSAQKKTPGPATEVHYQKAPPSRISYPGFYPATYHINAEYRTSPRSISGTQKVRYVNAEGKPMRSLYFRLWTNESTFTQKGGGTKISHVTVNGKSASFTVHETKLKVDLPSPLPDGRMADISLRFDTRIPQIAAPFGYQSGTSSLGVWYPVLAVYDKNTGWSLPPTTSFGEPYFSETANYDVTLHLPKKLVSIAAGTETRRTTSGKEQAVTYRAGRVRDFAVAISDDLAHESRRAGNAMVNVYYRRDYANRADKALDLASKSLKYYSKIYGQYPYHELDIVDAPLVAGTEFSTLTFINLDSTPDYLFDSVVPHEVAHQWWWVQVGSNQFKNPWLDESLATYSEWLFSGDSATRFPTPVKPSVPLGSPVSAFPDDNTYQQVVYLYGAQTYRALSEKIGKKTLLKGLKNYASKYRYRISTPEDLIRTLSKTAGKNLRPFFEAHGVRLQKNHH